MRALLRKQDFQAGQYGGNDKNDARHAVQCNANVHSLTGHSQKTRKYFVTIKKYLCSFAIF